MWSSKIDQHYEIHNGLRICQGDILRDTELVFLDDNNKRYNLYYPYIIVLSQDCDLMYGMEGINIDPKSDSLVPMNQYLPNVLLAPAFREEDIKKGKHLIEQFRVEQESLNSDRMKIIRKNKNPRYHYLQGLQSAQIPELIIDFKHYITYPIKYTFDFYTKSYLATVNELFREDLSIRFCSYLARIGLPELGTTKTDSSTNQAIGNCSEN